MTEFDLTLALTAAIALCVAIGVVLHWFWLRVAGAASPREDRIAELTAELLELETRRDEAIASISAKADAAAADFAAREEALNTRLRQTEAELEAAMAGLGAARRELDEVRRQA